MGSPDRLRVGRASSALHSRTALDFFSLARLGSAAWVDSDLAPEAPPHPHMRQGGEPLLKEE